MRTVDIVLVLLVLTAAFATLLAAVLHTIRNDGYGQRPGPRSHHDIFAERASDLHRGV